MGWGGGAVGGGGNQVAGSLGWEITELIFTVFSLPYFRSSVPEY
jgi:hypothetical protein